MRWYVSQIVLAQLEKFEVADRRLILIHDPSKAVLIAVQ
jgi:hypothetical protein